MIMVDLIKRSVLGVVAVGVLVAAMSVGPAYAESLSPWWGLTSGARPTVLQSGAATSEVQNLTVSATGGDVFLAELRRLEEFFEGKRTISECCSFVPYNASAKVVQEALEPIYPSRKVLVTGGPGDEGGTTPYVITFPGQSVEPVFASSTFAAAPFVGGKALSGGRSEASVREISKGKPEDQIIVTAQNRGDADTSGSVSPVTLVDELTAGLTATAIEGIAGRPVGSPFGNAGPVNCELVSLTCTFEGSLLPFEELEVRIAVEVSGAVSGENHVKVSGGGTVRGASVSRPVNVGGEPRFGIEEYTLLPENPSGSIDTQAGSHPFQVTAAITLNQDFDANGNPKSVALPKDLLSELPRGLIGNPTPFMQCTETQFSTKIVVDGDPYFNECPAQSAVGVATATAFEPVVGLQTLPVPIFNMKPRVGEPARFAFLVLGIVPVFLDTSVGTGNGYAVTIGSHNITQLGTPLSTKLTFWGAPGDSRHDGQRGWECLAQIGTCSTASESSPPPFLVMPTSCEAPYESRVTGDSWPAAGVPSIQAEPVTYKLPVAIDGCNHLPFTPSIKVTPDGNAASTPTGVNIDVHVPQNSVLNAESLAESAVKDISVALPEGVAINPAGGDGLQACAESQVGFTGVEKDGETLTFTPTISEQSCPNASKVGTLEVISPLLPAGQHVIGSVYLATQNENPFGSLIAMYLVGEDPISGVVFKAAGEARLTQSGQIIGIFKNTPQLAFEDAELHFFGGERAPLATPARCGAYTTSATFTPWSGNEPVNASSTPFNITSGPNGSPCPGATLPFSPSLTGGTTNIQAGDFSPLTTTISREDGNQDMQSVQLHMPAGLSGLLSGVKLCPEQQANEGTCGPESQVGETTVSAGVGSDPVSVKGGRVYITEKYAGAPFGLSIVATVKAGPFDLEHDTSNPNNQPLCDCVVVRAKIEVNPTTAELTITTDPSGPHAIPHLIDGIPVQIKRVNVIVNRPSFTFNPTNCSPFTLNGAIASDEGAISPVSVPFQATNCATLAFKPQVSASTSGKTSRKNGASLKFKLTYPKAPWGSQANIAKTKVDLPKQLPSRLTTLQKACVDRVFEANPANCPAGSRIGSAKAITPIIPVPLEGPVYFVSHGGAKFPELVIVLSGYGVTVELHGETFISKAGITSSTLRTIPDVPVGSFELTLPEGSNSALAANGVLCKSKLAMPIALTAQNGLVIHQSTKMSVTGCPKTKTKAKKKKAKQKK
jgi:hypothetical protein